jgi:hypothetical protein
MKPKMWAGSPFNSILKKTAYPFVQRTALPQMGVGMEELA